MRTNGKCTMLVMLDLTAAFDTVDHSILLGDLNKLGIRGRALSWFSSYLKDRPFQVVINNTRSDVGIMRTGVPQGSILGPILFLIYVMELSYIVEQYDVSCHFYADDAQIYFAVGHLVITITTLLPWGICLRY